MVRIYGASSGGASLVRVRVRHFAELPREGDLGRMVEVLVAEEDDLVREQRLPDFRDYLGSEGPGDVDAGDLRPDVPGEPANAYDAGLLLELN
jgi:hypothetical protein